MSYILEALKKSQSDRELGQVPRVEGFGVDVPIAAPRSHPWAYLVLLLALAALGFAGFALLRGLAVAPSDTESQASALALPSASQSDGDSAPVLAPSGSANTAQGPSAPAVATAPAEAARAEPVPTPAQPTPPGPSPAIASNAPAGGAADGAPPAPQQPAAARPPAPTAPPVTYRAPPPATTAATADAAAPALQGPESLSVEPQVLVVPAPAPPGEPLPRGAEELRRAVLGGGERVSASVDSPVNRDLPNPPPPGAPLPSTPALGSVPSEERVPVPPDLLEEIEAFKDLVRKREPASTRQAAATPPPLPVPRGLPGSPPQLQPGGEDVPRPPRPSLDLRNRLPPFSMTVHVYDRDPKRRFVYVNGRKLTESQQSSEGIRLERVLSDGAVLSYQGEQFFQQR